MTIPPSNPKLEVCVVEGRDSCHTDVTQHWANMIAYARLTELRICAELRVAFGTCCDGNHVEGCGS